MQKTRPSRYRNRWTRSRPLLTSPLPVFVFLPGHSSYLFCVTFVPFMDHDKSLRQPRHDRLDFSAIWNVDIYKKNIKHVWHRGIIKGKSSAWCRATDADVTRGRLEIFYDDGHPRVRARECNVFLRSDKERIFILSTIWYNRWNRYQL